MPYLARVDQRPGLDGLNAEERAILDRRFDANAHEINIDGIRVEWTQIDELEVAKAARESGPAGWIVKKLVFAGDRYHVAVYAGAKEAVLTNVTLPIATYVIETIAYYAPQPIRCKGVEGIAAVTEA